MGVPLYPIIGVGRGAGSGRPAGKEEQRNEAGDGFALVRIVAALIVIFAHSFAVAAGLPDPTWHVRGVTINFGSAAVSTFFVISGYLVVASWIRDPSPIRFTVRRVARLWPGLLVMLLVTTGTGGHVVTARPVPDRSRHRTVPAREPTAPSSMGPARRIQDRLRPRRQRIDLDAAHRGGGLCQPAGVRSAPRYIGPAPPDSWRGPGHGRRRRDSRGAGRAAGGDARRLTVPAPPGFSALLLRRWTALSRSSPRPDELGPLHGGDDRPCGRARDRSWASCVRPPIVRRHFSEHAPRRWLTAHHAAGRSLVRHLHLFLPDPATAGPSANRPHLVDPLHRSIPRLDRPRVPFLASRGTPRPWLCQASLAPAGRRPSRAPGGGVCRMTTAL
ncbi:MAG: acyltransferase [Chloroflexi bacterium]|nr:MAG: acyltransferase [Chloroflexota bacterium]